MPLLGGLFMGLFAGIAEWLTKYVSKKVALAGAAVATFTALTIGFYAAISAALVGISFTWPGGSAVALGVWLMVPDNAPACISAIISIDTAAGLYRWNVENIKFASYVT